MPNTFTSFGFIPPPSFQLSRLTKYDKKNFLAGKESKILPVMKSGLFKYLLVIYECCVQND